MTPFTSEYYPPLLLDELKDILELNETRVLFLIRNEHIKCRKMGGKYYVSINSLAKYITTLPKTKKEIERIIIRKRINRYVEKKILEFAQLIKAKNKANKEYYNLIKKISSTANDDSTNYSLANVEYKPYNLDFELGIRYSHIKALIKDVRKVNFLTYEKVYQKIEDLTH